MTLNCFVWKDRLYKFNMMGCLDFGNGRIKAEIGTLSEGVPNKHTRDGSRLKFVAKIGTKPWIA